MRQRRFIELQNLGQEVNMPALIADIEKDKKIVLENYTSFTAEDAHIIDSSNMSLTKYSVY